MNSGLHISPSPYPLTIANDAKQSNSANISTALFHTSFLL